MSNNDQLQFQINQFLERIEQLEAQKQQLIQGASTGPSPLQMENEALKKEQEQIQRQLNQFNSNSNPMEAQHLSSLEEEHRNLVQQFADLQNMVREKNSMMTSFNNSGMTNQLGTSFQNSG